MGRDKALLPYHGKPLAAHVAGVVAETLGPAGSVALIGEPGRYRDLGFPVHADVLAGCGPLGGVITALSLTTTEWNLVVACDMPRLSAPDLRTLVERALKSPAACVAASAGRGEPEPLCAVYHRRCLARLESAARDKCFKMKDLLVELHPELVPMAPGSLANVNTSDQWDSVIEQPEEQPR